MKEYREQHAQGRVLIENQEMILESLHNDSFNHDIGVQIANDGRVWVCIDGIAFIRFSPHPNGKMNKESQ